MFRKHTLEVNTSEGSVRSLLLSQLNKRRPVGKVEAGSFSLYKCLGSMSQGGFFYFNIKGDFEKSENGTRITYRVLPDTATCLILLCVTLALITVLLGLLGGRTDGELALTVVAVNVIMWGYSLWGMKDLSGSFETLLTGEEV